LPRTNPLASGFGIGGGSRRFRCDIL